MPLPSLGMLGLSIFPLLHLVRFTQCVAPLAAATAPIPKRLEQAAQPKQVGLVVTFRD